MKWEKLSGNEQLDLLALYVTGKLPVRARQELAKAALENAELFGSIADLTPLKQQITSRKRKMAWALNLWIRLREFQFPDISQRAFAVAVAGVVVVCGVSVWLFIRPSLPVSPVVDLRPGGEEAPVALADYGTIPFKIVDPQVQNDTHAGSETASVGRECQILVNGKLEADHVPSVGGFVRPSIPARSLRRSPNKMLTVVCGENRKDYRLESYFK